MRLLDTVLAMCGLNTQTSQEVKGVLEWIEQQGGLPAIVSYLQRGAYSEVVNSWLSDQQNVVLSSELVQKMMSPVAIEQLATRMGISTCDAVNLLARYLPQLVDKASSAGVLNKKVALTGLVCQLTH
ncbi:YidB family protein [Pantoea sp. GD03673]|uniref:YidB family protein n=1 Tax=Pantoea sp. GD03673 TaxID=2975364 RepID=UPI00244BE380|nr:YidB family protein [Pantoea sp. GD03673]MDH2066317.1 YidB family protein [Pantoea sp. GD03673]